MSRSILVPFMLSGFFAAAASLAAAPSLPAVLPAPQNARYADDLYEIRSLRTEMPEGIDPRIPEEVDALRRELGVPADGSGEGTYTLDLRLDRGPWDAQGYALQAGRGRATCTAATPQGLFYALQSFAQLCAHREGRVVVRGAEIADHPAFAIRGLILHGPDADTLRFMARYKFNLIASGATRDEANVARVGETIALCRRYFVDYLALEGYKSALGDVPDVEGYYRRRYDAGIRTFSVNFDDLEMPAGAGAAWAEAHLTVALRAVASLRAAGPAARLIFCPTPYSGLPDSGFPLCDRDAALAYLRLIGERLPKAVDVFWTGTECWSPYLTGDLADRYAVLIRRPPYLWENMSIAWCNNFTPLFNRSKDLYRHVTGFLTNVNEGEVRDPVLARPVWATVADYLWNPEAYDSNGALERAFRAMAGEGWAETIEGWRLLAPMDRKRTPEELARMERAAQAAEKYLRDTHFRDRLLGALRKAP